MNNQTPLSDLVDEVEDDFGNDGEQETFAEGEAQAEPEAVEGSTEPEAESATQEPKIEPGDGKQDEAKNGLPPWVHARVKAADEKAERYRQELEQMRLQQQPSMQQQPAMQQYQPSQIEQVIGSLQQENLQTRVSFSERLAKQEFGEEVVSQAVQWGRDKCDVDPNFNALLAQSADPVGDAVRAFRQEQTMQELSKHGGDLEKLIEAKLAERIAQTSTDAGGTGEQQSTPTPQSAMPRNFATSSNAHSARGASGGYSGPTPLSELLK